MITVPLCLRSTCWRTRRERVALSLDGVAHSYAELDQRARCLSHALAALGIGIGDKVAVLMGNRRGPFRDHRHWRDLRAGQRAPKRAQCPDRPCRRGSQSFDPRQLRAIGSGEDW